MDLENEELDSAQTNEGQTEVAEPNADESNQDENDFTSTDATETETTEETVEETDTGEEADSDGQKQAEYGRNAENAERRRKFQSKAKLEAEAVRKEAYEKGLLDAVGHINPFTGEEIVDRADIDEFLTMREIKEKGGDPQADYSKTLKEKEREKSKAKSGIDQEQDLLTFMQEFPDIDVDKLTSDKKFTRFAGKRISKEPLKDIYNDYISFFSDVDASIDKKAEAKAKNTLAKAKASPGPLTGSGAPVVKSYETMSKDEFAQMVERAKRGEFTKT